MSLQNTPASERVHIAFFGIRNVGKSSVVNAVTGQELSIVSTVKGTTTDPVRKTMELLPIGPVVIIDTPGIDDTGMLGEERVRRTKKILNETDLAVLVSSAVEGLQEADHELLSLFEDKQIPYLIVFNKSDLLDAADSGRHADSAIRRTVKAPVLSVSAINRDGIEELKNTIGRLVQEAKNDRPLVSDLVKPGDLVILVVPIDKSAPKGRLILPQQMVIRDLLDAGAVPVITRDTEYSQLLPRLLPKLVITDSQVFGKIAASTPAVLPLTSFSMIMARYKGILKQAVRGAKAIHKLQDGDTVLISEGCTHHRQCEDIGTVKMPKWLEECTGKNLHYAYTSGRDFPDDLSAFSLVIHCGGCMLNEREMRSRCRHAEDEGIPMTNYGTAIAEMHGILDRSLQPLQP
ncbi:MAG: [Eubacterium sp.]|nr:[FeFe] hydrogenase H-cluster maturation GTPase HydF [Eubacterium sp.]